MAFNVIALVMKLRLPMKLKSVVLNYADKANSNGGDIFPSIDRTAAEVGCHWRTIDDARKELEGLGILVREGPPPPRGSRKTTRYRIDLVRVQHLIDTDPIKVVRHERGKKKKPENQRLEGASVTSQRTMPESVVGTPFDALVSNITAHSSVTSHVPYPTNTTTPLPSQRACAREAKAFPKGKGRTDTQLHRIERALQARIGGLENARARSSKL
jgi:hypothetical protein